MAGRPEVTEYRHDISRFMVYLTRDDTTTWPNGGQTARQNFLDVFNERAIIAPKAHCLHAWKMKPEHERKCRVACFSEMPLSAVKHVAKPIPGRRMELEPYGFVVNREFIVEKSGPQVTYVNSYEGNNAVRESYYRTYEIAVKNNVTGLLWKQLPFVSVMNERYDVFWERECRVLGQVEFNYRELVCVILPEGGNGPFKCGLAQKGISWIAPEWRLERVVSELSSQKRSTRRLKAPKIPTRLSDRK